MSERPSPEARAHEAAARLGAREATVTRVAGGDLNEAFRVRGSKGLDVFVKTRLDAPAETFVAEAAGLRLLAAHVATPAVLLASETPPFLALQYQRLLAHGDDEALGRAIARVHDARMGRGELPPRVWLGPLELPNEVPGDREPSFFALRIAPLLRVAGAGLHLDARAGEHLAAAFDSRLRGRPTDRLLHGDLWSGNAAFDASGAPVLFDPAVGAGDPEADLAMMALFGGFSPRTWAAYRARHPAAPGEDERRPCYALFPLLVHHALFGGGYTTRVRRIVNDLLA
jgi:fructosamine-3-kinase